MIIGEIVAWLAAGLVLNRSMKRHEAARAAEREVAREQLATDLRALAGGSLLAPVAVPTRPVAPSEHRYFYAVVAGLVGFVATVLAIYGISHWLGSLETGLLGGLVVIAILFVFVLIIVPLAAVVAVLAWGLMMTRTFRRENAFELADFRHRFLEEREWLRARVESGGMSRDEAARILRGEEEPLDLARSMKKGSALADVARPEAKVAP